ncbi:LTA synthase family protein [Martelella alba]|uniref:LTA synthase family protein n=1 Tax=Martelella alba TaxID=2590451 RepID=A0ABY2SPK7_9HYPH|nr:alkaline phosphatase family protein [Martelella alba]TKI07790.1 LTA synthase family protein [Martelella alba]
MYQLRIRTLLRTLWCQLGILAVVLLLSRYWMLRVFVDPRLMAGHPGAMETLWLTGIRFDLRVIAILLLPGLLFGLIIAMGERSWGWLTRGIYVYGGLVAFIILLFSVVNFYYYQTFHDFIDIFAFGLKDDDAGAVLITLWQDYPIVRGMLAVLAITVLDMLLIRFFLSTAGRSIKRPWPAGLFVLYLLFNLAVFAAMARGSFSTFPLRRNDTQISTITALNKLAPNGLMAASWAFGDYQEDVSFKPVSRQTGAQLLRQAGLDSLQERTPANPWLAAHHPNVVMVLMESMGSNMLAFDQMPDNDLLGALREPFANDFVFHRFVSEGNGTAPSFAALFFHSPAQNISHSSAQHVVLTDTPYALYKRAGYQVVFITSGSLMWRNLGNYLPYQGVDKVYGQETLESLYPESRREITDWGVPDEYAFRLAAKLLAESNRPMFISILTVTNHPPYIVPPHYRPLPVDATPEMMAHAEVSAPAQKIILQTYQYSTDALGRFIAAIKNSPLADHTLIAASGDHQMRRLKAVYPREQFLDRGVPFYLYVPRQILAHCAWRYDPARVGSHKDILPTLYAYSLSDTPYQALGGRNMLAPTDDTRRAFGYNVELWVDDKGAYPLAGRPAFYPWATDGSLLLQSRALPVDKTLRQRLIAYPALLRWQLNARIKGYSD